MPRSLPLLSLFCTALLLALPQAAHSESLTTTFAGGNGQRGNIFDIVALSDVSITSFDAHTTSAGSGTIDVWWKLGTGYNSTQASDVGDWTYYETVPIIGAGNGNPTPVPLTTPLSLTAGETYSIYVLSSVSVRYTNGSSVGAVFAQDANLQVTEGFGCGGTSAWSSSCTFQPRVWNGTIHYDVVVAIDLDADGYGAGVDCDDSDPLVNPGATDLVGDGIDNNCDGIDGVDADGDSYASLSSGGGDCDDASALSFPGNPEICDGIDNDCLGGVDELFDVDGDGVTSCGADGLSGTNDDDCDDDDATVFPGNPEQCDGIDNDCNGLADFDADGEIDVDGDGSPSCADCDDNDSENSPLHAELCDGLDNNCNGVPDFDAIGEIDGDGDGSLSCADCNDAHPLVFPDNSESCDGLDTDCDATTEYIGGESDEDNDGWLSCEECEDDDSAIFPGNPEICDGLDNDCDSSTEASGGELDGDGDGFFACADCADGSAAVFPGNPERCDGLDNDCDPATDEDVDGDGDEQTICEDDCDDADERRFAGNPEICDLVDNDCDDDTDEEVDGDGDGEAVCNGDCDDDNDAIGSQFSFDEVCDDGLDNDCDSFVDDEDNQCEGADDNQAPARSGCGCATGSLADSTPTGLLGLLLLALGTVPLRRRRSHGYQK